MTASAPPESDLLPPEEVPPFRASACHKVCVLLHTLRSHCNPLP